MISMKPLGVYEDESLNSFTSDLGLLQPGISELVLPASINESQ